MDDFLGSNNVDYRRPLFWIRPHVQERTGPSLQRVRGRSGCQLRQSCVLPRCAARNRWLRPQTWRFSLGLKFWLVVFVMARYLWALYGLAHGSNQSMMSLFRDNLLVDLAAQIITRSLPLIPVSFWVPFSLPFIWYGVGYLLDSAVEPQRAPAKRRVFRVLLLFSGLSLAYHAYGNIVQYPSIGGETAWHSSSGPPPVFWLFLSFAQWTVIPFVLGLALGKGLAKVFAPGPRTHRAGRALLVVGNIVLWYLLFRALEPLKIPVGPPYFYDPPLPYAFWLIYPVAQIGHTIWMLCFLECGSYIALRRSGFYSTPLARDLETSKPVSSAGKQTLPQRVRAITWKQALFYLGIAWVLGCMMLQQTTLFGQVMVVLAVTLLSLKVLFPKIQKFYWSVFAATLLVAILWKAGSYHFKLDLFLAGIGFLPAAYFRWLHRRDASRRWQWYAAAIFVGSTWVLWSIGDALVKNPRAPLHPERFAALRAASQYPGKRVGIALSGGGYRAALLHAGILAGLEKLRVPVSNISSVSGGSIPAAFYTAGGLPEDFLATIAGHEIRIYRDLFDLQNAGRLIFPAQIPGTRVRLLPFYDFGRTNLQAEALDRALLGGSSLPKADDARPRLMIGMTDLNSGRAIGVSSTFILTRFLLRPPGEEEFGNAGRLYSGRERMAVGSTYAEFDSSRRNLAQLVAASGAFPLAFEPIRLPRPKAGEFLLSDGGITDNSGMTMLLDADWRASFGDPKMGDSEWALDLAISADGGAMFTQSDPGSDQSFARAMDIIGARIGLSVPVEPRGVVRATPPPMVLLSPSLYVDNSLEGYDYSRIGFDYTKGLGLDAFQAGYDAHAIDAPQQRLYLLISSQLETLDYEALPLLAAIDPWLDPGRAMNQVEESLGQVESNRYSQLVTDLDSMGGPLSAEELGKTEMSQADTGREDRKTGLKPPARSPAGIREFAATRREIKRAADVKIISRQLTADFSRCLQAFLSTPTLQDYFDPQQARRLFRLGEYLVFLNAHEIRSALNPGARIDTILTEKQQRSMRCSTPLFAQNKPNPAPKESFTQGYEDEASFLACMNEGEKASVTVPRANDRKKKKTDSNN